MQGIIVTELGPLRTRLQRAAGRGLTKFVGREREMEALKHTAELAKSGRGQIVAAMAEPGVGKSRLYFEFKATSQSGWMVLETVSFSRTRRAPTRTIFHSIELPADNSPCQCLFGRLTLGLEDTPHIQQELSGDAPVITVAVKADLDGGFAGTARPLTANLIRTGYQRSPSILGTIVEFPRHRRITPLPQGFPVFRYTIADRLASSLINQINSSFKIK